MATKTFYYLSGLATSPGYFLDLRDGGSAPAAQALSYGWTVAKNAAGFYRSRIGAQTAAAVQTSTSVIDAQTTPTAGTGVTNTTCGDSFVTPTTLNGVFAAGNWTYNWHLRTSGATATGRVRFRLFAGVNRDGTSARAIGTAQTCSTVTMSTANSVTYNSTLTYNPGAITLTNEYLFITPEWEETVAGTSNSASPQFYTTGSITTTDFSPPPTADAWNVADKTNITLSNSDKTSTIASTAIAGVHSTQTYVSGAAGKYYAEFFINHIVNVTRVGLQDVATDETIANSNVCYCRDVSGSIYVNATSTSTVGSSLADNDVISMAWDAGAKMLWFRRNAGLWNNNASADPSTNTGGVDHSVTGATSHALLHYGNTATGATTVRTELAEFTQAVPSGFSSWMGEAPVSGGVTVNATGVAAGTALGTTTVSAVAPVSFEAVGVAAGTALGTALAAGKTNISTAATGATAAAVLGAATVNTVWNVTATSTGQTAGTALGAATVSAAASASTTPTGQTAATALGNVSVAAGGAVSVIPAGVAASALTGTASVAAQLTVTTTPTGVATTALSGTAGVAGAAVTTPSSVTAATALGAATVTTVQVVSVTPTGVSAAAASGGVSVAVGGGISITPSSLTATALSGTATVAAQQQTSTSAAGVTATALSGTAGVSIRTSVAASGVTAAAVVGAATVTGKQAVMTAATGVSASTLLGGVSVAAGGSVSVAVSGQAAAAVTGTATVTAKRAVSVAASGVAAATADGVVVATGKTIATGVGQFATALVGTVTVTTGTAATGVGVWTGSAWVDKPVKVWTGTVWMQKPVKVWNGSVWV